ncbi:UNKNOWN [Stylonychia lemnae]|uniref:Uncharacterized protein n=1 Tax=Stylonychia lemnae TaxID=5949 RepID=A0A078AWN0_STYLE|nr:UNKNOWN [Stylonychia lemnae]|eukprot:CDW85662.1 UNKNOWN [Stylonychia lemnae]
MILRINKEKILLSLRAFKSTNSNTQNLLKQQLVSEQQRIVSNAEVEQIQNIQKESDKNYQQDSVMKFELQQQINHKSNHLGNQSNEETKNTLQSSIMQYDHQRLNPSESRQAIHVNSPYDKSLELTESIIPQNVEFSNLTQGTEGLFINNQNQHYDRSNSLKNAEQNEQMQINTSLNQPNTPTYEINKEGYILASKLNDQKGLNLSKEKYITAQELYNSMEIISTDPQIMIGGLKKLNKDFQDICIKCIESQNQYSLNSDKKQTIIFINSNDGNLFTGQNDLMLQSYNSQDFSDNGQLQIPSEPISILIYQELIYLGLNNDSVAIYDQKEYKQEMVIKTEQIPLKILPYIPQDLKNGHKSTYILFLEKDGYIEFYNVQQMQIIFTYKHTCGMSIQDAVQVVNKNQLCLGFAQLIGNAYKDGKLGFVEINILNDDDYQEKNLEQLIQIQKQKITIKELKEEDNFIQQSVFCVQQISLNCFVVCVIDKNIKIFNRLNPKAIKDIQNPSTSINYNALRKIDGFGDKLPYLLFRDSRSIGIINCSTLDAQTILEKSNYSRCGNIYCLEQKRETDGKLSIYTFTYDREQNKRELLQLTLKAFNHQ